MSHYTEEEAQELASGYALGVLDPNEAKSFREHLATGCDTCSEELRSFEELTGLLGFAAQDVAPSSRVRENLLRGVRKNIESSAKPVSDSSVLNFLTIRSDEGDWLPMEKGVFVKRLFADKARDTVSVLIKMSPGSSLPRHFHKGVEECLMIEGELYSGDEVLKAGDYQVSLAGSTHDRISTKNGALFLIVGPSSYEPLERL